MRLGHVHSPRVLIASFFVLILSVQLVAAAPCVEQPPFENHTGAGQITCPCFIDGEQAGAVFDIPAEDFPIEILRVGVGWASVIGGAAPSTEQAIHIYGAALPDPGTPIFTLTGPVLTDGVINEYDLEILAAPVAVASGPFTVTLEFANDNSGMATFPSLVHDGNGAVPGMNVLYASPGIWMDASLAGVGGDWVFHVIYRKTDCGVPVEIQSMGMMKSQYQP